MTATDPAAALPSGRSGASALAIARDCARTAESILRDGFGTFTRDDVAWKGKRDPVTEIDTATEEAVLAIIRREFPDHGILAEETAHDTALKGCVWVIDPLDGTRNFANQIPHFAFNLALCRGGDPLLGLTLDPLRDEEFLAIAGHGATLNGEPIRVSAAATLPEAIVATDMGYPDGAAADQLDVLRELWPGVQAIRIGGSAALDLAYTAAGRWDLFLHHSLSPWDVAPGLLLVREAGGLATTRTGAPSRILDPDIVAGGPAIHAAFLAR